MVSSGFAGLQRATGREGVGPFACAVRKSSGLTSGLGELATWGRSRESDGMAHLRVLRDTSARKSEIAVVREHSLKGKNAMRILFTRAAWFTTAALLIAAAVSLGGGVPAAVHYIGHDK